MPTTRRTTRGKRARERLEPTRGSRMDERCTGNQPGPARRLTLPEHSGAVHAAPARRPIGRCAAIAAVAGEDGNRACGRRKRAARCAAARASRRCARAGGAMRRAADRRPHSPADENHPRRPARRIMPDARLDSPHARMDRRDARAYGSTRRTGDRARRPDVPGAYAAAQASAAKIKAAESEFMPKVFVSASTPYNAGRAAINAIPPVGQQAPTVNLNGSRYGGGVFVGVTIPRYDGGLRSAVLMQARNDAGSASARLERTKDEAVRQIVTGQNALRASLASHDAAATLVNAAQTTATPRSTRTGTASARSPTRCSRGTTCSPRKPRTRTATAPRCRPRRRSRSRRGRSRRRRRRNDASAERLSAAVAVAVAVAAAVTVARSAPHARPRRVAPRLARRRTKRDRASPPRQAPPTIAPSRRVSAPSGCASSSSTEKCVRPGTCTRRTGSPAAAHACA